MKTAPLAIAFLLLGASAPGAQTGKDWQSVFPVDKKTLGVKGSNAYFILPPGYQLSYKKGNDTDTVTVLNETKLIELTRDYYAIDSATNDVYYFGEDVDTYRNGKVTGHEGAWLSGVKGANFGLMIPGKPRVGQRFYEERAPGVGMDRAEIVSDSERVTTAAGTFEKCIHTLETSALEKKHGRPQVVCGGRGSGERREDAVGEVRE